MNKEEQENQERGMEEQEENEHLPSLIDEEENLIEENEKWNQYFGQNKTVNPATSTSSSFYGFSTVSREDSINDVKEDLLLTNAYKDNTLQFYATQNVSIAPYSQEIMISDIINAPWFTPTFPLTSCSSRKKFNKIFVTAGMCPHPQVADGIYPVRYNQIQKRGEKRFRKSFNNWYQSTNTRFTWTHIKLHTITSTKTEYRSQ